MKKTITLLALLFQVVFASAQIGAVAPDFTVTDLNGEEHNLYTYLDAGKVVVLDVSATWCGPCWSLHQAHTLNDLNNLYGPDGTDQIVVIFYEGDAGTGDDAINGTGGNTLGDWVTGTTYPIINESPLTLSLNTYAPEGFPTVNIISPDDKKIKADVYNQNLAGMEAAINQIITLGPTSTNDEELLAEVKLSSNPTNGAFSVTHPVVEGQLSIVDVTGKVIYTSVLSATGTTAVDVQTTAGMYFVQIATADNKVATKKVIIE